MYESYNEIFKQGKSLRKSYDYVMSKKGHIANFFKDSEYEEIVFIACGSSYWLSASAHMTFQEKLGVRCCAVTSGEVIMNEEYYKKAYKKPLVIAPSRSGSTSETLKAVKFFKQNYGSRVLSIAEYEDAPIKGLSDLTLEIPWANEISVCQTRSFSNMYMVCVMIAAIVGNDSALLEDINNYIEESASLMSKGEELLRTIIKENPGWKNFVSIGNGKQYGISCEGAYICIEMAQLPSNYYNTLELRHGPIVMLDSSYIVSVMSGENARELEENMAKDARNKGAKVIAICDDGNFKNADYIFSLGRKASPEVTALYGIFVMQGAAYLKAVATGVDPDNPKELVRWIKI